MTSEQIELIIEIIDLKVSLINLTNRHDKHSVEQQIQCREQDLRDSAEDEV